MTMRVVIVDDEELARRGIRTRLQRGCDIDIVAECGNAREAIGAIRRESPDVVFLDVQMPGKTGFEVIESVGWDVFPHVIFVTAHDRYAVQAFEVNALDYLLKPIDDDRFDAALQRARESLSRDRDSDMGRRLSSVLRQLPVGENDIRQKGRADRIVVRSGGRVVFVKIRRNRLGGGRWRLRYPARGEEDVASAGDDYRDGKETRSPWLWAHPPLDHHKPRENWRDEGSR